MKTIVKTALVSAILSVSAAPAFAQSADVSPTLLIETGPNRSRIRRQMTLFRPVQTGGPLRCQRYALLSAPRHGVKEAVRHRKLRGSA